MLAFGQETNNIIVEITLFLRFLKDKTLNLIISNIQII